MYICTFLNVKFKLKNKNHHFKLKKFLNKLNQDKNENKFLITLLYMLIKLNTITG